MKIYYWSANSIPELAHLSIKDKTESFRQIQKEGCKRFGNTSFMWFMGVWLVGLVAMLLAGVGVQFKTFAQVLPQLLLMVVWSMIPVTIGHFVLKKGREWFIEQHQPKAPL